MGDPGIERLCEPSALLFFRSTRLDRDLKQPAGEVKVRKEFVANPRIRMRFSVLQDRIQLG
jgi:hypothetical protein